MSAPPANVNDFPQFLSGLQNKPEAEVKEAIAAKCQELETIAFGVNGAAQCRDVSALTFLFKVKQLGEFLHFGSPPATLSRAEWPAYRPLFEALVARGDFPARWMDVFAGRKSPSGSFFESEFDRQTEAAAAAVAAAKVESPQTPPPPPVSTSPPEPPPLPTRRNPKEPPPLPRR